MDRDRIRNHPHPHPRLHPDNGAFVIPSENIAVNGVNSMTYFNHKPRLSDHPSSSFSSEIPNYRPGNPIPSHDPYLHPSSVGSSSRIPSNYSQQHGPSCYNRLTGGEESGTFNPQMDSRRVSLKRKRPSISEGYDRGNAVGHYSAGSSSYLPSSSSNLPSSSSNLPSSPDPSSQARAMSGPQSWPCGPSTMVPSYRSNNFLPVGEGFQRNVRSRHSHAPHLEVNTVVAHSSSNLPYHSHLVGNNSGLNMAGQWNHTHAPMAPQRRVVSLGNNVTNGTMGIDGGYYSNLIPSRNQSTPLPTLHGPSTRGMGVGRSSYRQITTPYRAISSFPSMGFAATALEDTARSGIEAAASSRNLRPLSFAGRSSERNSRARGHGRFQSFPDDDNARSRWGIVMMDPSTFYVSRNLFDQHQDMRLDVDNMSYEELLALADRIGTVSTGLTEDMIPRCLKEMMYRSSNQIEEDQEEGKCVVCLEEFKAGDNLGILKCGHDFHVSCIKQWLLIKNVCPICKASALVDTRKEK